MTSPLKPQLYFVNAWIDGFFIGFASIALFLYLRYVSAPGLYTPAQWNSAQVMIWALNWPHVFATSCRLYHSETARRQYPMTSYCVPVFMLLIAAVAFGYPQGFGPYVIKVLLLWAPFHFSGQTIGITLMYLRRGGITLAPWMRSSVIGFAYCAFMTQICQLESLPTDIPYATLAIPLLGVPVWTVTLFRLLTHGFLAVLLLAAILLRTKEGVKLPWIAALPLFVQYLWFVLGSDVYAFQLFVSALHGLQYLLIAWSMQLAVHAPWPTANPVSFVAQKSLAWTGLILLGGATLFYLTPLALSQLGWGFSFTSAIIFAVLQFHHFFVDGVIWKLRDPRVSRYLMGNVFQMARAKGGGE